MKTAATAPRNGATKHARPNATMAGRSQVLTSGGHVNMYEDATRIAMPKTGTLIKKTVKPARSRGNSFIS